MLRCLIVSWFLHLMLLAALVVMNFIAPSRKPIAPSIRASFRAPGPPGPLRPSSVPPAAAAPVPAPEPPKVKEEPKPPPKPKPTQPPIKKAEAPKKFIAKGDDAKKIVEAVTPTPSPTPTSTPKEPGAESPPKVEKTLASKPEEKKSPPPVDLTGIDKPEKKPAGKSMASVQSKSGAKISMSVAPTPAQGPATDANPTGTGADDFYPGSGETYGRIALFMIQRNFEPPYNMPVRCVVQFKIMRDGTIVDPKIVPGQGSGRQDLDQAALRALKNTEKLPELYEDFTKPFIEVAVTFEFERAP